MSTGAMAATLIGAGGVVLGSAIATVPPALLAVRRDRREIESREKRELGIVRVSGRLVVLELMAVSHVLAASAATDRLLPGLSLLPTSAWRDHRAALAGNVVSPADWQRVTEAYSEVDRLNALVAERRGLHFTVDSRALGEPVGADTGVREVWLAIGYAIGILQLVVGDQAAEVVELLDRAEQLWPTA